MATTYREAIQRQQKALQQVYDNAEGLRDAATDEEKAAWNILRGLLNTAISTLYKLDNGLQPGRAEQTLIGTYLINANPSK
jgi:hypothetical protein